MAVQKAGAGCRRDNPVTSRSQIPPRFLPARTPRVKPSRPDSSQEEARSQRELEMLFPDHLRHWSPIQKGGPHISSQNIRRPGKIPLCRRQVHSPVSLKPLYLLRTHGSKGRLAHIGLKGIHRRNRKKDKGQDAHQGHQKGHTGSLEDQKPPDCFSSSMARPSAPARLPAYSHVHWSTLFTMDQPWPWGWSFCSATWSPSFTQYR